MMSKNLFGVSEARGTTPITRTELFSSDQHAVADLDVDGDELAALVAAAGSNGEHLALLRFLPGGVRNDYAARGRSVRWLSDSVEAFLVTGKRSGREIAVILDFSALSIRPLKPLGRCRPRSAPASWRLHRYYRGDRRIDMGVASIIP
jgi:hypothetical protein